MPAISTLLRVLSIIGVLLHAGLIVWHNAAVVGSAQSGALMAALSEICHGSGSTALDASHEVPPPDGEQGMCPICKGAVSAVAVLPTSDLRMQHPDLVSARIDVVGAIIALRLAPVRPPTRGPPLLA